MARARARAWPRVRDSPSATSLARPSPRATRTCSGASVALTAAAEAELPEADPLTTPSPSLQSRRLHAKPASRSGRGRAAGSVRQGRSFAAAVAGGGAGRVSATEAASPPRSGLQEKKTRVDTDAAPANAAPAAPANAAPAAPADDVEAPAPSVVQPSKSFAAALGLAPAVATATAGRPAAAPISPTAVTAEQVARRTRQLDLGKRTPGYANYVRAVPQTSRKPRRPDHPVTPDPTGEYSKRQWDGIVRKWRRQLHTWDTRCVDDGKVVKPRPARAKASGSPPEPIREAASPAESMPVMNLAAVLAAAGEAAAGDA